MSPYHIILLIVLSFCGFTGQGQIVLLDDVNDYPEVSYDPYYNAAYFEIENMLRTGDYDIKRAAFLLEWAYLEGEPDYEQFCQSLTEIAARIKTFIEINKLDEHPIGGNIALFEYFTNPSPLNNFKHYDYDFNDFEAREDYRNYFVLKLMETHSGQCRSLPLLYKLLADEIGAEAYIALAPQHSFIRHPDGEGGLLNVELTNRSLAREIFIIESFGITQRAVETGIYMKPLNQMETIVYLLADLADGYESKYVYDDFTFLCALKCLEYEDTNLRALMTKYNSLRDKGIHFHMKAVNAGEPLPQWLEMLKEDIKETEDKMWDLGYTDIPEHLYEEWEKALQEELERRQSGQS